MEHENERDVIVALYTTLGDVQVAMDELQKAHIPYPDMRMSAHTAGDSNLPVLSTQPLPERFWSLSVMLSKQEQEQAVLETLRKQQPLAIGRMPAANRGRKAADSGAIAWRHYVFESPSWSDQVTDAAGTTGTTGVISSGVFATGAHAEGNPPARGLADDGQRPSDADVSPTTDDRQRVNATDGRSRPSTDLKP